MAEGARGWRGRPCGGGRKQGELGRKGGGEVGQGELGRPKEEMGLSPKKRRAKLRRGPKPKRRNSNLNVNSGICKKGKRLVFVTNNSTKSRKQYGKKFETLGLNVNEEEIVASSFAAAAYLQSIDFPTDKKVYVIGEDGILKELELAGFQYLGGPADGDKKIELKPGFYMEHDKDVRAVVVGFDRYFNRYKVQWRINGRRNYWFN